VAGAPADGDVAAAVVVVAWRRRPKNVARIVTSAHATSTRQPRLPRTPTLRPCRLRRLRRRDAPHAASPAPRLRHRAGEQSSTTPSAAAGAVPGGVVTIAAATAPPAAGAGVFIPPQPALRSAARRGILLTKRRDGNGVVVGGCGVVGHRTLWPEDVQGSGQGIRHQGRWLEWSGLRPGVWRDPRYAEPPAVLEASTEAGASRTTLLTLNGLLCV